MEEPRTIAVRQAQPLHGRRLPCQIMYELLRLASHGERKTRLMYGANISYALLAKYLDFLQEKGFLVASDDGVFAVTDTGIHFMGELGKVLKHFGPEERL